MAKFNHRDANYFKKNLNTMYELLTCTNQKRLYFKKSLTTINLDKPDYVETGNCILVHVHVF